MGFISTFYIVVLLTLLLFKLYLKCVTGNCACSTRLDGKIVVITGANTGIGYETAKRLAGQGGRIIIACRNRNKGEEAAKKIIELTGNNNVVCMQVDFSDLKSVRCFAKEMIEKEPRVDILINNAGAAGLRNKKTADGLQVLMQVNHFGPFLLTNLLLDHINKSTQGRIIFISSVAYKYSKLNFGDLNMDGALHFDNFTCYSNSKLCNILAAKELAKRVRGTRITVNVLHPGMVQTDIFRRLNTKWYNSAFRIVMDIFFKDVKAGSQTSVHLALSPHLSEVSGKYFEDCREASVSGIADNANVMKFVWIKSCDLLNIDADTKLHPHFS